ncbi:MAG: acyl-CoA dehydrogenase family protein [Pseudomonadota bacterium]
MTPIPERSTDRTRDVHDPAFLMGLRQALSALPAGLRSVAQLQSLIADGWAGLPAPGAGRTLQRWQALAAVAEHDLSLAKLYEGHTDALAIQRELHALPPPASLAQGWGTWAAESASGRVTARSADDAGGLTTTVRLHGTKSWCSGAAELGHGLMTAWVPGSDAPQLVRVAMRQPGVGFDRGVWHAVGMAGSASIDVSFDGARAERVGQAGDYLSRPGFWHGGAGVAACWHGGAVALAASLRHAAQARPSAFRSAALGRVDVALQGSAAMLREAARWIDDHPHANARSLALRVRLSAEQTATRVLDEAGRALGAGAFCRDAVFARMAADLPVFVRQSHAEHDLAALGDDVARTEAESTWWL